MMEFLKVLLKSLIAVLIIPLAFGVSMAFYHNLIMIKELSQSLSYFLWGIAAYTALHLLFYKPTFLYVLGHEAVHAGVAWLFGAKISSFQVSKEGGAVGMDKSNVVIELSPYFVPIYAVVITLVYFVLLASYNINGSIFVFLIGFALAFHIISTIEIMKVKQPDFVKSGYFFSIVLVYLLNILIIALMFGLVFPSFHIKRFFLDFVTDSKVIYFAIVKQLFF
jgi:hypothetical protein